MPHRDWLDCLEDFVGLTLLALLFLLPLPNCFLRVCLPTLFAAVLKFFLPLTISAFSDTSKSNKSAPTCLAAETRHFHKKVNWSSHKNLCMCTKTAPTSTETAMEKKLSLSWSNLLVKYFRLETNVRGFSNHPNKTSDTNRYKGYFFTARVSQVIVNTLKKTFEQRSKL